jgi:lipopolysaccharide export system protein LptC
MGRALPGHLVDEGKLVLFLDEEIASRAPKRGRRRKAETQRRRGQGRPKKRKTETETETEIQSLAKSASAFYSLFNCLEPQCFTTLLT